MCRYTHVANSRVLLRSTGGGSESKQVVQQTNGAILLSLHLTCQPKEDFGLGSDLVIDPTASLAGPARGASSRGRHHRGRRGYILGRTPPHRAEARAPGHRAAGTRPDPGSAAWLQPEVGEENPGSSQQEPSALLHDRLRQARQPLLEEVPSVGIESGLSIALDDLRRPLDVIRRQGVFQSLVDQVLGLEPLAARM